jgi:hypothetical protein
MTSRSEKLIVEAAFSDGFAIEIEAHEQRWS